MTIEELQLQIQDLQRQINQFNAASTISHDVEQAFRSRFKLNRLDDIPEDLKDAPLSSVTAPSGGTTIDSQARTAINSIITRLEDLGLVSPN